MSLQGKIAVVTGASRGIGRAIAQTLAEQGAFVVGTATTENGAKAIATFFEEKGLKGTGAALNFSQPESIAEFASQIEKQYGVTEILVNNAGITRDNLMLRMKDEEWNDIIEVNLNSVYRLSKAFLRSMLKNRWGRIINITSVVGVMGNPGQANYAAAKAGIIGFSKSLALEVASRGITVNCVAPGFIETDMTNQLTDEQKKFLLERIPAGRMGEPNDIAAAVRFLSSPEASYITGQTLHVNGGMLLV